MANKTTILHKRSSATTQSTTVKKPQLPTESQLDYGEIAVNFSKGTETLSIKNSANEIVEFKNYGQINEGIQLTDQNLKYLEPGLYWADHNNSCQQKPSNVTAFSLRVYKVGVNNLHLELISGAHKAAVTNGDIYRMDCNEGEWTSWTKAPVAADKLVYSQGYTTQTIEGEIQPGTINTGNITASTITANTVNTSTVNASTASVNGDASARNLTLSGGTLDFTVGTPTINTNVALRLNPGGQGVLMQKGDLYLPQSLQLQGNSDNLLAPAATISATGFKAQGGTSNQVFTRDGGYKTIGTDFGMVTDILADKAPIYSVAYMFNKYHTFSIDTSSQKLVYDDTTINDVGFHYADGNNGWIVKDGVLYLLAGGNRSQTISNVYSKYICFRVDNVGRTLTLTGATSIMETALNDGTYLVYATVTEPTITWSAPRYTYLYGIYLASDIGYGIYKKEFGNNILIHMPGDNPSHIYGGDY